MNDLHVEEMHPSSGATPHLPVSPSVEPTPAFVFTGTGGAYFRIWIVNVLLSVLTLGIFSAWAKVRREQFFHRNARVAGHAFDYHADPLSILKGRIVVAVLLGLWQAANALAPVVAALLVLAFAGVGPALVHSSLRFRLQNTSWRGIRFGFNGEIADAYAVFLGWPLVNVFCLGLLTPLCVKKTREYLVGNAALGSTPFSFHATTGAFYMLYLAALGIIVVSYLVGGSALAVGVLADGMPSDPSLLLESPSFLAMLVGLYLVLASASVIVGAFIEARTQDLVWNNTVLGPHRFVSSVSVGKLFTTYLVNLLLMIVTLGLFRPFAVVRVAKLRFESMTLVPGERLDTFVAAQLPKTGTFGEEASELLDVGVGL